jgi:hypothetical protein
MLLFCLQRIYQHFGILTDILLIEIVHKLMHINQNCDPVFSILMRPSL